MLLMFHLQSHMDTWYNKKKENAGFYSAGQAKEKQLKFQV